MKKLFALVKRNLIEMLREPLTLIFCVAFPVVMLVFMQIIFSNFEYIPDNFRIENYAMGICVFGYTFTSMFVAMSIASDKNSSFIKRIVISPIRKTTYLCSYLLSALPVALCQTLLFFIIALFFGLPFNGSFFLAIVYLLPSALFYISLGILLGVVCNNEKQTGPINSVVISLTGILGGIFMPLNSFSGGLAVFVNALPFSHTVQIASELYSAGASCIYPHIFYILGYSAAIWLIVVLIEKLKRK